jgi:hypothetical protein
MGAERRKGATVLGAISIHEIVLIGKEGAIPFQKLQIPAKGTISCRVRPDRGMTDLQDQREKLLVEADRPIGLLSRSDIDPDLGLATSRPKKNEDRSGEGEEEWAHHMSENS